jgi:hypothetical protein
VLVRNGVGGGYVLDLATLASLSDGPLFGILDGPELQTSTTTRL